MDSEVDLLARAATGSRADFDRLYDVYFPRVYALAMRRLGRRGDAEQVTRQVFLELVEALASSDRPPILGWIMERTRLAIERHAV
jgi:DNA-directed RNA polymerase specialized sigma24 family protein